MIESDITLRHGVNWTCLDIPSRPSRQVFSFIRYAVDIGHSLQTFALIAKSGPATMLMCHRGRAYPQAMGRSMTRLKEPLKEGWGAEDFQGAPTVQQVFPFAPLGVYSAS